MLTIFAKSSLIVVLEGPKYASDFGLTKVNTKYITVLVQNRRFCLYAETCESEKPALNKAYMQCNESVNCTTFSVNKSKMTVFSGGRELNTLFKGLSIH